MSRNVRHSDSEDSEDEIGDGNAHSGPGGLPVVEDEAEVHTGFRASFPLSFGKQESKARTLEAIHSNTKRSQVTSKKDKKNSAVGKKSSKWIDFEGSRFQAAADEEPVAPSLLIRNPKFVKDQDDGELIGPPLPSRTSVDDDGELIGPPLPSRGSADDDGELIGPPLPGRAPVEDDEELIGPPLPSRMVVEDGEEDEDDDDDDDGDDEDPDEIKVPISNEIVLKGPGKVVCAVAVDHTGSRVLIGSYDFTIHMYDFQGMNEQLRSFRQMEPSEGHQVRSLSWSPSADRFLAVTGSAQAKIYDRDGLTLGEFLKGDMYIRDLKNTKGHISGLTAGQWHPKEREKILTSSEDGSLRIWDVTDFKSQKQVIKPKLARPGRVSVSTCCWGMDGKCLAGGLTDGSVQIWNVKAGWGSRPDIYIEKAHEGSDDVTGLCFSADGRTVLSRSTDSTLKVWDLRQTKVALKVFDGLTNSFSQTSVSFSPDERLFLTGTSIEKGSQAGGLLVFFNKASLEVERKVGLSATQSVVCTSWHPRLNQIFATAGDRKGGATHVLYDPALSDRGALVCVSRAPRKKSAEDIVFRPIVHTPHSLPMFREDSSRKRQREKALLDPLKSKRPDLPVTGPGFGGRIGTTKGSLLTQYLMKEGGMIKEKWKQEDPREAILKHADAAAKEPSFFGPAYANTQPVTILEQSDGEEEEEAK